MMKLNRTERSTIVWCIPIEEARAFQAGLREFQCTFPTDLFAKKRKRPRTFQDNKIFLSVGLDDVISISPSKDIQITLSEDTNSHLNKEIALFLENGLFTNGELGEFDYDGRDFDIYLIGF